jgi:hypothetical protein
MAFDPERMARAVLASVRGKELCAKLARLISRHYADSASSGVAPDPERVLLDVGVADMFDTVDAIRLVASTSDGTIELRSDEQPLRLEFFTPCVAALRALASEAHSTSELLRSAAGQLAEIRALRDQWLAESEEKFESNLTESARTIECRLHADALSRVLGDST